MKWMLNVIVSTPNDDEVLSIARLPPAKGGSRPFDPHSLDHFSDLIVSDADSAIIRSISRASRASITGSSGLNKFIDEVAKSPEASNARRLSALPGSVTGDEVKEIFSEVDGVGSRTICETLEKVKTACPLSPESQALFNECNHTLSLVMREEERVLYIEKFWCRWGWTTKRVVLVLSFSPVESKLYLVDAKKSMLIRALPWSNTKPVKISLESDVRFNIEVIEDNNKSLKTLHFYDDAKPVSGAVNKWVKIILEINKLRERYVRQVLGPSAHEELQGNLSKLKGSGGIRRYCVIT